MQSVKMSDEYHQSGAKGSLVNPCELTSGATTYESSTRSPAITEGLKDNKDTDFDTGNYPPQSGDCTFDLYCVQITVSCQWVTATSSGGHASTERHPDTNPDAKELNISGAGHDLGLVGSGEPEGVDRRGEDAYGAAGARIPSSAELDTGNAGTKALFSRFYDEGFTEIECQII
jgi:hypothetical protein